MAVGMPPRLPAQTRRPLPPSTRVRYNRAMTIAAGFTFANGVMLCADTLHTGWGHTVLESKMSRTDCSIGSVVFAFAGHQSFAKAAITTCHRALKAASEDDDLFDLLSRTTADEYYRLVLSVPTHAGDAQFHYRLLIGARYPWGDTQLFSTEQHSLSRCADYTCIGDGESLALYLLRSLYSPNMELHNARIALTHVMAKVKSFIANCGGPTQFQILTSDNKNEVASYELLRLESIFRDIDDRVAALLIAFSDARLTVSEVAERLVDFERYLINRRGSLLDGIPSAMEALLSSSEYPTADPSLQQPSLESPAKTDES
jgi:20S proteasome alpha/beta subunit